MSPHSAPRPTSADPNVHRNGAKPKDSRPNLHTLRAIHRQQISRLAREWVVVRSNQSRLGESRSADPLVVRGPDLFLPMSQAQMRRLVCAPKFRPERSGQSIGADCETTTSQIPNLAGTPTLNPMPVCPPMLLGVHLPESHRAAQAKNRNRLF